jgi:hypothetical protein
MRFVCLSISYRHRTCDLFEYLTCYKTPQSYEGWEDGTVMRSVQNICYGGVEKFMDSIKIVSGRLQESPHKFRINVHRKRKSEANWSFSKRGFTLSLINGYAYRPDATVQHAPEM